MDRLSLDNPLFTTYVVAATLMILKVVAMAWLTVWRHRERATPVALDHERHWSGALPAKK